MDQVCSPKYKGNLCHECVEGYMKSAIWDSCSDCNIYLSTHIIAFIVTMAFPLAYWILLFKMYEQGIDEYKKEKN